jgi:hypothetical protein
MPKPELVMTPALEAALATPVKAPKLVPWSVTIDRPVSIGGCVVPKGETPSTYPKIQMESLTTVELGQPLKSGASLAFHVDFDSQIVLFRAEQEKDGRKLVQLLSVPLSWCTVRWEEKYE